MVAACPIPTPEERRYRAVDAETRSALLVKVHAALDEATASAAAKLAAIGSEEIPSRDYFMAVLH